MGTIFRMGAEIIRGNNLTINSSSLVFKWQQMRNFIILWQSEQKRNSFYLRKCALLFTYDEMRQAMRCVCDDDGLSRVESRLLGRNNDKPFFCIESNEWISKVNMQIWVRTGLSIKLRHIHTHSRAHFDQLPSAQSLNMLIIFSF